MKTPYGLQVIESCLTCPLMKDRGIAEKIAASRETVTRMFASFKREGLLEVHGSTVLITNKTSLEKLIGA
jgi:CRP-like cAMP-binding protein